MVVPPADYHPDKNVISDLRPGDVVLVPFYPLFDPDNSVYSTESLSTSSATVLPSFPVVDEKVWVSEYRCCAPGIVVGSIPASTSQPSPLLPELLRFPYWHRDAPGPKTISLVETDKTGEGKDTFKDALVMVQLLTHMDITLPFPIDRLIPWAAFDFGARAYTITRKDLQVASKRLIDRLSSLTTTSSGIPKASVQEIESSRAWLRIYRAWWIALTMTLKIVRCPHPNDYKDLASPDVRVDGMEYEAWAKSTEHKSLAIYVLNTTIAQDDIVLIRDSTNTPRLVRVHHFTDSLLAPPVSAAPATPTTRDNPVSIHGKVVDHARDAARPSGKLLKPDDLHEFPLSGLVGKHYSRGYRCRPNFDSYARRPMRLYNENWKSAPINATDLYKDRLEQLMSDDAASLDARRLQSHLRLSTVNATFAHALNPHGALSVAVDKVDGMLLALSGANKELLGDILYISYL